MSSTPAGGPVPIRQRTADLVAEITQTESLLTEAYRAMVRGGSYPEPVNAFKQACNGTRHPQRQLMILQLAAIRSGRPIEQVLKPTRANEAWVRSFYLEVETPLIELVLAENRPDMELDEAQQLVMREESPANLQRLIERADRHVGAIQTLRNAAALKLCRLSRGWRVSA